MGDRRFDFYDWMCIAKCFDFVLISHMKNVCMSMHSFVCVCVCGWVDLYSQATFCETERESDKTTKREYETTFKYKKDR